MLLLCSTGEQIKYVDSYSKKSIYSVKTKVKTIVPFKLHKSVKKLHDSHTEIDYKIGLELTWYLI